MFTKFAKVYYLFVIGSWSSWWHRFC